MPDLAGELCLDAADLGDADGLLAAGTQRGDFREGSALVGRIALYRIDELGNEIVAALELHIDVAPGRQDAVLVTNEAVVNYNAPEEGRRPYRHSGRHSGRQAGAHGRVPGASVEIDLHPQRLMI